MEPNSASDQSKKRNLSELSESSVSSPVLLPKKLSKINPEGTSNPVDKKDESLQDSVKTSGEKIDEILVILKRQSVQTNLDITSLRDENRSLHLRVNESDGIISRLTAKVTHLEYKLENLETHSMKTNLIFYNIPESQKEDCLQEIARFMKRELKMEVDALFSKENPSGEIRLDIAHRMGQKGNKPRPIVARFVTQRGRDMVLRKAHLLKATPYAMSEQLPSNVRERRTAQIPILVDLRREARETDSKANIKLIRDRLVINNKTKSDIFEKNPLDPTISTGESINYNVIHHSNLVTIKGSTFQGYYYPIHCMEEAVQALRALHQNKSLCKSHHFIYAYNYCDTDDQQVSGYSNDGEWKASSLLKGMLDASKCSDGILMVTSTHDGPNLAKQRFHLLERVIKEVLDNASV